MAAWSTNVLEAQLLITSDTETGIETPGFTFPKFQTINPELSEQRPPVQET